jgi:hypothetical protein
LRATAVTKPVFKVDVASPTKDKPQSKLWFAHGSWWAWLPVRGGSGIWRRTAAGWQRQTSLDESLRGYPGQADVWAERDQVTAVLVEPARLAVIRLKWNSRAPGYELGAKPDLFELPATGASDGPVETATIARDSRGRWWFAYNWRRQVWARSFAGGAWSEAAVISKERTMVDDLCAIVALPGRIGVLWSDQNSDAIYLRLRSDNASPEKWDAVEIAQQGGKTADDHIHAVVLKDGTLCVATKNSVDEIGKGQLVLRVRGPGGRWTNHPYAVRTEQVEPSRPIIVVGGDPERLMLAHSVYTKGPSGSRVVWQSTDARQIDVSLAATPLIDPLGYVNDVTGCKAHLPEGQPWIVLASGRDGSLYEAQLKTNNGHG